MPSPHATGPKNTPREIGLTDFVSVYPHVNIPVIQMTSSFY